MRRNEMGKLPGAPRRGAFTLIELLVVIAIIAALMALSASAVLKYLSSQEVANTKSTLDRTQSQLNKAWARVKDQAYKEAIPSAVDTWIRTYLASNASNPNDPNVTGRVRVIYVKLKLRQAFPMNFNEALFPPMAPPKNPCPMPPLPAYTQYLGQLGITGSIPANYESSACLLMALNRGVSGGGIDPAELTAGGATGSVTFPRQSASIPGGTLNYLTDARAQPLYFTRVPVGSPALNSNPYPGPGQVGNNDPLDPQGYLQTQGWATLPSGQITPQAQLFQAVTLQQLAGKNSSYKQAPMLCSSGQDKQLSTNPITFSPLPPPGGDGTFGDDLFSTP